jgi:CRISPR-associated protein Cas1
MIKKTIYFGNAAYLKRSQSQIKVEYPADAGGDTKTVPIEDVGLIILDHPRITITQALLTALIENNAAVLCCNSKHMPEGLFMPFAANTQFTEKLRYQLNSSEPLRKSLWQQTIKQKIANQYQLLHQHGIKADNMLYWEKQVKSGDPDNYEGRAAAYYWKMVFGENRPFKRWRYGDPPNNLLNYGYAILRSVVARSLVASGMLPAVGIHHRNKYNAFCLADDIMEPYRPYVDEVVLEITEMFDEDEILDLSQAVKAELLRIPALDVTIDQQSSPLMVAVGRTTASLMQCFEGERRKILYPVID